MKNFHCFAYATGRIGFGDETPDDALPIYAVSCSISEIKRLEECVGVLARHAYDNKTLLVPGIPEAVDMNAAYDALIKFNCRVKHHMESV
ncbi:TPA: hypothetical protein P2Q98_000214 [Aeromonas veronii]|uniref:hypothetical protein n=1 Tax=Aeromonas veronii TaxID=654 RepID=UPI003312A3D5|nr:hypothetical protein [Aeromonas veronii]HDO1332127.1 hypothetical protein [Aeromonas veronii]HDO1339043.1 hypothetical protein [Aeromonas veronii]HDO1341186.1 hypothetical protein [Aeromonas veronii]HDO1345760.1 hypothetical protein [Aeromonas veronii]